MDLKNDMIRCYYFDDAAHVFKSLKPSGDRYGTIAVNFKMYRGTGTFCGTLEKARMVFSFFLKFCWILFLFILLIYFYFCLLLGYME